MRQPIAPLGPEAVSPVEARPGLTAHPRTARERTFAELLAEAEAVQDFIEIRRQARGLRGALAGAAGFVARQTPWLGLPLLLRHSGGAGRRRAAR